MAGKRVAKTTTEVQSDLKHVQIVEKTKETLPPKEREAKVARKKEVLEAVKGLSVEKVVQNLTNVGLDVSKALADVSEKLIAETKLLNEVREATEAYRVELKDVHNMDTVATATDVLLREYEEKQKSLETQMVETRTKWNKEVIEHDLLDKERKAELEKQRLREDADYKYSMTQVRKKEQDGWTEQLSQHIKTENERRELLEKTWIERERNLKTKENELASLQKQVADFPLQMDAAAKKAEAIATNSVKRDYEHKIALMAKDAESSQKLLEAQVLSLRTEAQKKDEQVTELQRRIAESDKKVQSIAEKALESASGARALAEITQFTSRNENPNASRNK